MQPAILGIYYILLKKSTKMIKTQNFMKNTSRQTLSSVCRLVIIMIMCWEGMLA